VEKKKTVVPVKTVKKKKKAVRCKIDLAAADNSMMKVRQKNFVDIIRCMKVN
jgi:hypothetical protein